MKHYEYSYTKTNGFTKNDIEYSDIVSDDEILVKNKFVGICGSDLFHHSTLTDGILFLGHEWVGEVITVGKNNKTLSPGDWITTSATLGCGECQSCLEGKVNFCEVPTHLGSNKLGALRSFLKFKSFNALKLKGQDISEVLIEVMAVAEEAMSQVKQNLNSKINSALVMGGGTVGILCAHLLNEQGIIVTLVDVSSERVARSRSLNIKSKLLKEELLFGIKNSFELVIDATSDRDFKQGGLSFVQHFLAKHSLLLIIGKYIRPIEMNPNLFSLLGTKFVFMRGVPLVTLQNTISKWSGNLIELYKILATHEFNSCDLDQAFELAHQPNKSGKIIIKLEEV